MAHILQREGQPLVHVTGVTGKHEPFTVCSLEIESWSHLVYLKRHVLQREGQPLVHVTGVTVKTDQKRHHHIL